MWWSARFTRSSSPGAATAALNFTQSHFGWFYLFATTAVLVFCVGIAFSSYGSMRLGTDGVAPEFSYPAWL